jgi:hypothetical protein
VPEGHPAHRAHPRAQARGGEEQPEILVILD